MTTEGSVGWKLIPLGNKFHNSVVWDVCHTKVVVIALLRHTKVVVLVLFFLKLFKFEAAVNLSCAIFYFLVWQADFVEICQLYFCCINHSI